MKKLLLLFLVATLGCGNLYSQAKKPVRRTANVAAKQKAEAEAKAKAEAEAKAKAEAEAKAKAEAEEAKARDIDFNNSNCRFGFGTGEFISLQSSNNGFVVYEIPNMSASELKASVFTTLSSMYKSPKDVITSLSENMIQLEGYAEGIYGTDVAGDYYRNDIAFALIIQFKDGKVRYNSPNIKMIYQDWPLPGMAELDMNKPISVLIEDSSSREKVANYFNSIINTINSKLKQSNDW